MSNAVSTIDPRTTDTPRATSDNITPGNCEPNAPVREAPREQWWHPQPVATFLSSSPSPSRLALTTIYTYPTECVDRWMLFQKGCDNPAAAGSTAVGNQTIFSIDPVKNIVSDPSYVSCQRFATPTYSPGVCPDGHTVAEVTVSMFSTTSSIKTFWQASCCKSGMTVGPEYPTACISHIATPLRVHALVTQVPGLADVIATPAYEYMIPLQPNSTVSNIVTVTAGMAIADPIVVGWQKDDLTKFPADYSSSLQEMLAKGPEWVEATPTSNSDPASQNKSDRLSAKAKVGIGVGVALGVLFFVLGAVVLLLRRRRKRISASKERGMSDATDDDNHHTGRWWNVGGLWRHEAPADNVKHEMYVENKQHELASKANENELDSKALGSEQTGLVTMENEKTGLDTIVTQVELDSKLVLNELDSRAVYLVPGPPAELSGAASHKHTEHRKASSQQ